MSKAVYKYQEDFGRHGSLESLFVANEAYMPRLLAEGHEVYLCDVLGKHSEVTATVDETTVTQLSGDPRLVAFVEDHLGGCFGVNILSAIRDQEGDEDEDLGGEA